MLKNNVRILQSIYVENATKDQSSSRLVNLNHLLFLSSLFVKVCLYSIFCNKVP